LKFTLMRQPHTLFLSPERPTWGLCAFITMV
jgi:hypothetical protein